MRIGVESHSIPSVNEHIRFRNFRAAFLFYYGSDSAVILVYAARKINVCFSVFFRRRTCDINIEGNDRVRAERSVVIQSAFPGVGTVRFGEFIPFGHAVHGLRKGFFGQDHFLAGGDNGILYGKRSRCGSGFVAVRAGCGKGVIARFYYVAVFVREKEFALVRFGNVFIAECVFNGIGKFVSVVLGYEFFGLSDLYSAVEVFGFYVKGEHGVALVGYGKRKFRVAVFRFHDHLLFARAYGKNIFRAEFKSLFGYLVIFRVDYIPV